MPPASRISDGHRCPKHKGGPIDSGCDTVIIAHEPAAREGDTLTCYAVEDVISGGEPTVLIGGKPAARIGDPTAHGGQVAAGCPTVIIGGVVTSLQTDKPFCEDCEKKYKEVEARQARRRARGK